MDDVHGLVASVIIQLRGRFSGGRSFFGSGHYGDRSLESMWWAEVI